MWPDLTSLWDGEIADISMSNYSWTWTNPRTLISPPEWRGSGLLVPRGDGEVPMEQRLRAGERTVRMRFTGRRDNTGAPVADEAQQLLDALDEFTDSVYLAARDTDHTLSISVTDRRGTEWTGRCQPLAFDWAEQDESGEEECNAVLRLYLPQALTAGGS